MQSFPQRKEAIGRPLSPYAATKHINEIAGEMYSSVYGLPTVGLRYFNVFGPRQNPEGAYAAVIPRWIEAMVKGDAAKIYGKPSISRDFTVPTGTPSARATSL